VNSQRRDFTNNQIKGCFSETMAQNISNLGDLFKLIGHQLTGAPTLNKINKSLFYTHTYAQSFTHFI
jgi:hypothetical protein